MKSADISGLHPACDYGIDAFQRSILFWDVLRRRGNDYIEHRDRDMPAVLEFPSETVIDGRTLERPCNYALLRIDPDPEAPNDPTKRPYVVVDPRAGHGPGIGGSKVDSQVGVARRAGHPVYFVTFTPRPVPGQTLRDVAAAEAHFIEEVARRHPRASGKPCVVGNCQAGWAVAALASVRPELMGPILLNGAPLSYWSGARNNNPMRYSGGLVGGKWPQSLLTDLGDGLFDGANLVLNFENLDPANTHWKKAWNLYRKIDTEGPRFLGFEKWWGGFFLMNREEIDQIVADLFIGNRLVRGGIATGDGAPLDLCNIASPIVVFASLGDNITPPQQALNWIEDVYGDERAIVAANRTIVYLLHDDIGHLGIFVSGRVAAKEHSELVATLDMIDALPAGLYEMVIERKESRARGADLESGDYLVRFEARTIDDIRALDDTRGDESRFETVDQVSQFFDGLYQTFMSPWVRAVTTPESAEFMRRAHPLRLRREIFSDCNPVMPALEMLAAQVRADRRPVPADNPFLAAERSASDLIVTALDTFRDLRDGWSEMLFQWMYGPMGFGAIFPSRSTERSAAPAEPAPAPTRADYERGDALTAILRILAAAVIDKGVLDRRSLLVFRALRERSAFAHVPSEEVRALFREQARLLRQDREQALAALAVLLPDRPSRERAVEVIREILLLAPDEVRMDLPLARSLAEVLGIDPSADFPQTRGASRRQIRASGAAKGR